MFLQSYVASICEFKPENGQNTVHRLHGTGFFINGSGTFLTARHVIEEACEAAINNKNKIGIFPMALRDGEKVSLTAEILAHEFAPKPFDVAIGKTAYSENTIFKLEDFEIEVWQDVATMGYPISVSNKTVDEYQVQQRVHKGYIQRIVPTGRLPPGNHPDVFELNFPVTKGLSGSPLFVHFAEYDRVVGICVGTIQSEVVDYEQIDIIDKNNSYSERNVRIEEFGIAQDIRRLLDWKVPIFGNKSLLEISRE